MLGFANLHMKNQTFLWFSFFSVVGPFLTTIIVVKNVRVFWKWIKAPTIYAPVDMWLFCHIFGDNFFFSLVLFLASADFVNENLPFFSRKNWSNSSVILRSYFFLFSTLYYGPYFHCKHILILVDILSKKTQKNDFFGLYYIVFWEQNRIYDKK